MANADTLVALLDAIGNAIRAKTGDTAKLTLAEMPDEIAGIETRARLSVALLSRYQPVFNETSSATAEVAERKRAMIESIDLDGVANATTLLKNGGCTMSSTVTSLPSSPSFKSWDTSGVTLMSGMFENFKWMLYANTARGDIDLTSFDTSSVTNMSNMFNSAVIGTLDLSSFDTTNVTGVVSMFANAYIDKIIFGPMWKQPVVSTGNKAQFPANYVNEQGLSFSSGAVIPDGAHTYTRR